MSETGARRANAILGYPPDARLLIVNADDCGMCHAINAAIAAALRDGIATSTTIMAPCPWSPHAFRFLKEDASLRYGVHLTLVRDFGDYRWGPLTSTDRVPSLVDRSGCFYHNDRNAELLAGARLAEVEREFRAQIEAILAEGLAPTHLDWHCLADGGRDDIFDLSVALAREYGLAVRVHDRARAARLAREGLPTVDHPVLDSYRFAPAEKPARYAALLRALPVGLTEWAVHPSLGNAEAQALEPETWRIRRADLDFLLAPATRALIAAEGITLLDYGALQAVWRR